MHHSYDVYSDGGAHLKELIEGNPAFLEMVKGAAAVDEAAWGRLPESDFAWSRGREFLIADKGNTGASVAYFIHDLEKIAADLPAQEVQHIAKRLADACERFKVAAPAVITKLAESLLPGPPPAQAAPSQESVTHEIHRFLDKVAEFRPESRRSESQRLLKLAQDVGMTEVPVVLVHYGSDSWNPDVQAHVANRVEMSKQAGLPAIATAYETLAGRAGQGNPEEFAGLLSELDKKAGLAKHYDTRIADPYYATFGVPQEEDPRVDLFKKAAVEWAKSPEAQAVFNPDLLEKMAADPLGTLKAQRPDDQALILASIDMPNG